MTYEKILGLKRKVCPYTNIRVLEEFRRVHPEGLLKTIVGLGYVVGDLRLIFYFSFLS